MNHRRAKDPAALQLRTSKRGRELEELLDVEVDSVRVSRAAQDRFIEVHGGSRQEAHEGVLDTLEDLIQEGHLEKDNRGYWQLYAEGYRLVLAPEKDTVVGYATLHRERTLGEVRDGVKSRLRGAPVPLSKLGEVLTEEWVDGIVIPGKLVNEVRGEDEFADVVDDIRDAIEDAAEAQAWERDRDRVLLRCEEWSIWLRQDVKRVVRVERTS